jgi:hypothetical protein
MRAALSWPGKTGLIEIVAAQGLEPVSQFPFRQPYDALQEPKQGELFPEVHAPPGATVINARCMVRTRDAHRVVIVAGVVIAPYALGDRMAEAYRR